MLLPLHTQANPFTALANSGTAAFGDGKGAGFAFTTKPAEDAEGAEAEEEGGAVEEECQVESC